ncbi:hypothetical protein GCM10027416_11110 [Okibacterium endophyticum]
MTSTRTASATRHKIAATVVGLAGVMLALTGCGAQSVDGEYWNHQGDESTRVVIDGSTFEIYELECADSVPTIPAEPTTTGEVNADRTEMTATVDGEQMSVPIHISDGVLTMAGQTATQMSESEGLASSHVCDGGVDTDVDTY